MHGECRAPLGIAGQRPARHGFEGGSGGPAPNMGGVSAAHCKVQARGIALPPPAVLAAPAQAAVGNELPLPGGEVPVRQTPYTESP